MDLGGGLEGLGAYRIADTDRATYCDAFRSWMFPWLLRGCGVSVQSFPFIGCGAGPAGTEDI